MAAAAPNLKRTHCRCAPVDRPHTPSPRHSRRQRAAPARTGCAQDAMARRAAAALALLLALCGSPSALADPWQLSPLPLGDGDASLFNPSVVLLPHGGGSSGRAALVAARGLRKQRIDGIEWWFSSAQLCTSRRGLEFDGANACRRWDPWLDSGQRYDDCLKRQPEQPEQGEKLRDAAGIEDVKLFVWPGRGVFATFNRKPRARSAAEPHCAALAFTQFLVRVDDAPGAPPALPGAAPDAWGLRQPVELSAGRFAPQLYSKAGSGEAVKEKNWMPFVWRSGLFFVHSVMPHRVFRVNASGVATQQWVSSARALLPREFLASGSVMHGGPPLVFVPAHLSSEGRSYFLGVMHYFDTPGLPGARVYHHYAFKMEPRPPFRVCAVSGELPLLPPGSPEQRAAAGFAAAMGASPWQRDLAFAAGLQLLSPGDSTSSSGSGGVDEPTVLLSYGAFDAEARLLRVTLAALEAHFGTARWECGRSRVLRPGEGEEE